VAQAAREPAYEDLTARARIRDAALRLFAQRGVDGATIRDIAAAAGVSAGLVRHHFGTKEELRDACDAYLLDRLIGLKDQAMFGGELANPAFMAAAHPTVLLGYRYFARAMIDGSPAAAARFDRSVELAEQWLARHYPDLSGDRRAYAVVVVAMQTGLLAMHEHVSRALGVDVLSPEGHLRLAKATVDVYSRPLLDPDLAAQAHAAFDRLAGGNPPPTETPPRAAPQGAAS